MNQEENISNKCPICGRPTHKESGYCIFHASSEKKTEVEFKQALKQYVNKTKEEDSEYDFYKFIFVGDIDFKKDLDVTTFEGADFMEATFRGFAGFKGVTFKRFALFSYSTFESLADFMGTTFQGGADFMGATLRYGGNFREATFKKAVYFREATFKKAVYFHMATFEGDASFSDTIFERGAVFGIEYLVKDLFLFGAKVFPGEILFIKINNGNKEGKIIFGRSYLENVYLELELVEGMSIDFNNTILRNTIIKKGQIDNRILQEKKKKYYKAKGIYLLLKNNFHSIGQYEDESWAFTKEKDMEKLSKSFYSLLDKYKKHSLFKKILKKNNILKRVIIKTKIFSKWLFTKKPIEWFNLSVSDFLYQYGENPWRVIRFALIIILLFAIILNFSGIVISDRTNLIIEFIKESQGDEYTLKYLEPILGSFLNCLYFSVVTFTTLGYGDFQPAVGASRFFVSLESIIGAFTMALFVYTFARRTGGR